MCRPLDVGEFYNRLLSINGDGYEMEMKNDSFPVRQPFHMVSFYEQSCEWNLYFASQPPSE